MPPKRAAPPIEVSELHRQPAGCASTSRHTQNGTLLQAIGQRLSMQLQAAAWQGVVGSIVRRGRPHRGWHCCPHNMEPPDHHQSTVQAQTGEFQTPTPQLQLECCQLQPASFPDFHNPSKHVWTLEPICLFELVCAQITRPPRHYQATATLTSVGRSGARGVLVRGSSPLARHF